MSAELGVSGEPPRRSNAADMLSRAVRFHVLICPACTPYFFANSERVSSSRIASSATLALKSGAWFFLFVILDHFFHQSIHLNKWSEIPRPPLILNRLNSVFMKTTSQNSSIILGYWENINQRAPICSVQRPM